MAKASKKKASKKPMRAAPAPPPPAKKPEKAAKPEASKTAPSDKKPKETPKEEPKLSPMQQKEPKTVPITKHLKVQLTEAEIKQLGHDAARYEEEATRVRAAAKRAAADAKTAAEELESKRAQALSSYAAGFEFRDVDCEETWDYKELIVRTVRLDTGAEINRRNMTRDELQLPLPQKKPPTADGTEKMSTAAGGAKTAPVLKAAPEAIQGLKEAAIERMNEDGDRTASELRARARKQDQLLEQIDAEEAKKTEIDHDPPQVTEDGEIIEVDGRPDHDGTEEADDEPAYPDDSIDLEDLADDDDDELEEDDGDEEDEETADSDDDR